MRKIPFLCFVTLLMAGCTEKASINFLNRADDPFEIFIDGVDRGSIAAHGYMEVSVEAGTHKCNVVQTLGFTIFPTKYAKDITVDGGKSSTWSWGNLSD